MKAQEESFFKELDFDYDDSVDGKRAMNQLLNQPLRFELAASVLLGVFLYLLPK